MNQDYEEIINKLKESNKLGGALNLYDLKSSYLKVKIELNNKQKEEIRKNVCKYVINNIFHGQLVNLEGLDELLEEVDVGKVSISPDIKEKIAFYNNNLKTYVIENLLIYIKPDDLQEGVKYLKKFSSIEATEETVKEVRKYGQLLLTMNNRNPLCFNIIYNKYGIPEFEMYPSIINGLKKFFGIKDELSHIKDLFIE